MAFINNNIYITSILLILLISNVNSINDDQLMNTNVTTEAPLQECKFNITIVEIGNTEIQYCPNKRRRKQRKKSNKDTNDSDNEQDNKGDKSKDKNKKDSDDGKKKNRDKNDRNTPDKKDRNSDSDENKKSKDGGKKNRDKKDKDNDKKDKGKGKKGPKSSSDSLDEDIGEQNTDKKRVSFVKTCVSYEINGQFTNPSEHMAIFLPLCSQTFKKTNIQIELSDVTAIIANDTFENNLNVENAVGYSCNGQIGMLIQLIDETVSEFGICVENVKQKNDNSLDIDKLGKSEGIVWINSANKTIECAVHGLPCFKFNFRKRCDRMSLIRDKYNTTSAVDDEIPADNALMGDDMDEHSDTGALNVILSKRIMWTIIAILGFLIGLGMAYLIYICKRKKSDVYRSALPDENEVEMDESSGDEGENTELQMITTKLREHKLITSSRAGAGQF